MKRDNIGRFVKGENIKDLTGQRFGMLTVVRVDRITSGRTYWICKCDCGKEKSIRGDTLTVVRSCGCIKEKQDYINLRYDRINYTSNHRLYPVWADMIARCQNPNCIAFKDYGGRGIKVCEEWKQAFNFFKWAEESGYKYGLSIERVDVNKGYNPENCTWIPMSQQANNRRNSVKVTVNGVTKNLTHWVRELGIPGHKVWGKHKSNLPIEVLILQYM
jgi:hypothetical protein